MISAKHIHRVNFLPRGIAIVSRPSVRLSVRNVEVPWAYAGL